MIMISIIVPVYNAEKYIAKTIEMVCAQTYTDWELILVNDCSQDESVSVIKDTARLYSVPVCEADDALGGEHYIRLIQLSQNGGAANARNTGIEAARGRYIAFLDADDVWRPDKLERELRFMQTKDAGFVFTSYEFGDENAVPTGKVTRVPAQMDYRHALTRTVIFTSTIMIDTHWVDKSLIFMPQIYSEDTATWWNILRSGIIGYGLDELLVIYRRPAQSLSSNKVSAIKRIWDLYRKQERISLLPACVYMFSWAFRATWRRVVPRR